MSRPVFKLERRGNGHRMKTAMPRWSHQQELERLIGKEVMLTLAQQLTQRVGDVETSVMDVVIGKLTAADAFTIQLIHSDKSVVTYFKHDIQSFEEKTPAA
jgi:hypothetical protein